MRSFQYLVAAVALVVEEDVADVLHVHAYLVGASGFEDALDEGDVAEAFEYAVVGDGMLSFAIGQDSHLHAVARVAADVARDGSFVLFDVAPHQGTVAALRSLMEELVAQVGLGVGGLGDDEQAGGVLVDAMDETTWGSLAS